ncbi:xanthine dehydrogenase accessory protein XdhC [Comamonas sp.]|uniref:xanthine dehydrogenase accessory protein XdhC n=1 Tax=Comamonas sp. TaxID=34028 RepID=UPI0028ADF469|nr:xanthine dehydrogenase accessory protein XdhC [Comamonas sp.]
MPVLQQLLARLATQDACLVQVESTQGSAPRDTGAWMAVFAQDQLGTIGGGHLEWQAASKARDLLARGGAPLSERFALGPRLGQCCGGVVQLRFERIAQADSARLAQSLAPVCSPVAVFGAGHVGAALVQLLGTLPLHITWVDSREQLFPPGLPAQVQTEYSDPIEMAVADLAPGSSVFILTHDHQQDLQITQACLQRQRQHGDLDLIGLIGSATKRASFAHRLAERGFADAEFARITCPIGLPGIHGKEPEVIAIAVAAQLLLHLQRAQHA